VNARDAMPTGGTITIEATNVPGLNESELQGDFVRLKVKDTGTGMSRETLARVFEPFFTTKEIGKGSGLGLAQVHGFATQSGGRVTVESVPGAGTTVALLLPRSEASPIDVSGNWPSALAKDGDATLGVVLLVEDNAQVGALVTEMLTELGYEVLRVASADAALGALANGRKIDVVFSDVMMPGTMNGIELARKLKQERPDLPVLLSSGYAEPNGGRMPNGIEVLGKPYELADLAQALARARATL
jgi:CheY-like chemotaxis protein